MADLFSELRQDHERIETLLDALRGDPAGPKPQPSYQEEVAEELVALASKHEVVEERFVWPRLREEGERPSLISVRALEQESTGKKLLNELDKTKPGSEEFDTLVNQVASELRQHVMFEETQAWPLLQLVLHPGEAERLGREAADARKHAPTRPHPMTPPDARVLAAAGPTVGLVDRARDKLRNLLH
jgi:hemerythrin-like domain-containing protein